MDVGQLFCLRWNNYQATLQQVFHKLWMSSTFIDVTLIVEGRRLGCHKVVLSACSTYFEDILSEHSSHPHPLILLHDLPLFAVESLVTFMYRGEVNVSKEHLSDLLRVASALRIKGLADSNNFSHLTENYVEPQKQVVLGQPVTTVPGSSHMVIHPQPTQSHNANTRNSVATFSSTVCSGPRQRHPVPPSVPPLAVRRPDDSHSPGPLKKRSRTDELVPSPHPPSPASVAMDTIETRNCINASVNEEPLEEPEGELQIDESGSHISENNDNESQCSSDVQGPVPDAIDTEGEEKAMPCETGWDQKVKVEESGLREKNTNGTTKTCERSYTSLDLEEGIEAVLLGRLTPAKAIAQYRIPRRTFFRRLSVVRKSRGIPSAKENSADQFLSGGVIKNYEDMSGLCNSETTTRSSVSGKTRPLLDPLEMKSKKPDGVMGPSNTYVSLLSKVASNNFDAYIKYLKSISPQSEGSIHSLQERKDVKPTIDNNRNLSSDTSESALALVTHNGTSV